MPELSGEKLFSRTESIEPLLLGSTVTFTARTWLLKLALVTTRSAPEDDLEPTVLDRYGTHVVACVIGSVSISASTWVTKPLSLTPWIRKACGVCLSANPSVIV